MTKFSLRGVLLLDAASCGAIFALGVLATASAAQLLGLPEIAVSLGGWICLAAGALLAFLAARPVRPILALAVAGNAGWVVASLVAWIAWFGQLTEIGHVFVLAQAAAVAVFIHLEMRGLRVLSGSTRLAA